MIYGSTGDWYWCRTYVLWRDLALNYGLVGEQRTIKRFILSCKGLVNAGVSVSKSVVYPFKDTTYK